MNEIDELKIVGIGNILVDTNLVNAREKNLYMNQLEYWFQNEIISYIYTDITIEKELKYFRPGYKKATKKGFQILCSDNYDYLDKVTEFSKIVFKNDYNCLDDNEKNDIDIIYCACNGCRILVTNDGASKKQPRGILGSRKELEEKFGLKIYRDYEIVNYVMECLIQNSININFMDSEKKEVKWFNTVFSIKELLDDKGKPLTELRLDDIIDNSFSQEIRGYEVTSEGIIKFDYINS